MRISKNILHTFTLEMSIILTKLNSLKIYIAVAFTLISAALFRIFIFYNNGFLLDGDSIASVYFAINTSLSNCLFHSPESFHSESNGILYYLALHYLIYSNNHLLNYCINTLSQTGAPNECSIDALDNELLHLLPLIFSLSSVLMVYYIGKKLGGTKAGLLSSLFFSFNSTALSTSAYCRFYQMNIFCCLLSTYLLLCLINTKKHYYMFGMLYVISSLACIASMMNSIFLFPCHIIYWYYRKQSIKHYIPFIITIIIVFIVLWTADSHALQRKAEYGTITQNNYITFFTIYLYNIFGIYNLMEAHHPLQHFLDAIKYFSLIHYYNIIIFSSFVYSLFISFNSIAHILKNRKNVKNNITLPCLWTSIPIILMFIVSICYTNIINKDNVCFICPGAALLLGCLTAKASKIPRWTILTFIALSSSMNILVMPPDYDKLIIINYLNNHIATNSVLIGDQTEINAIRHPSLQHLAVCYNDYPSISSLNKKRHLSSENMQSVWLITNNMQPDSQQELNRANYINHDKTARILFSEGYAPIFKLQQGTYCLYFYHK